MRSTSRVRGQCSNTSPWWSRCYCCCHQTMEEQSRSPLKQFSCPRFLFEDEFPVHWVKGFIIQCAEQIELSVCKEEPPRADCNPNYIYATHLPVPKHNNLNLAGGPLMSHWFFLVTGLASFLKLSHSWDWFLGPSSFCLCLASFILFSICDINFITKFPLSSARVSLGLQLADFPVQIKVVNPNNSHYWGVFECVIYKQALHVVF